MHCVTPHEVDEMRRTRCSPSLVVIMTLVVIDNGFGGVSWCTVPCKAIKRDLVWLACCVFVNSSVSDIWDVIQVMIRCLGSSTISYVLST